MSKHIPTKEECTATHIILPDDDGKACIVCANCGQFIRPHKMNDDCPGPDPRSLDERIEDMKKSFNSFLKGSLQSGRDLLIIDKADIMR